MQHKSKPPILYNVIIEGERQITVDWGNEPGWIKKYKDDLDNARRISLVPKQPGPFPLVSVFLDDDKKWVVGSRVVGEMTNANAFEFRLYFIGWQKTIEKNVYAEDGRPLREDESHPNQQENVKVVHWVYPGGAVETAPEPTMVEHFKAHFRQQLAQQGKA